ncbi:DUF4124 domain-containing protein [Halomonas piscis]|uniref:DUF4124 domain-containing protein n=1 Tax=Halomonas piscis TaxID=3031727 RepID=A0ABY9Z0M7_9GAMM|nr:DUF4124 domain-containing protein [Halomonas piscis]WNK20576.1 DUF4124 domain-containing protein [Halomonas piscis]
MRQQRVGWLVGMLMAALAWGPLQAQTVYRVVDEAGNVTFTDDADSGGREVTLKPLQGVSASTPEKPSAEPSPGAPFMPYDRFVIARPASTATLPAAPFPVEVEVRPALRDDHRVRLLVDGSLSQSALRSDAFWVPRLAPGEHRLQAELLDARQRVRHRTPELEVRVAPGG